MPGSNSSMSEEKISYICKLTKVSRGDLIKTIRMGRVNLDQVIDSLKKRRVAK